MDYYKPRRTRNAPHIPKRRVPIWLSLIIVFVVLLAGTGAWALARKSTDSSFKGKTAGQQGNTPDSAPPKPPVINLQPVTDAWLARQNPNHQYSFVVYDPDNGEIVAQSAGDTQYFAASIYKLYVAYLGYMDVESGARSAANALVGGRNIQECLHEMIYSSDSPCAETLLSEMGQAETTEKLKSFGLTGTSFPAFMTTADDAVAILKRLHARQDLGDSSATALLASMKDQIYRDGFQTLAGAVIYDKIGFYETGWHDVGLMELPNGRTYLYAFLSKGSGSKPVADFAATIFTELNK